MTRTYWPLAATLVLLMTASWLSSTGSAAGPGAARVATGGDSRINDLPEGDQAEISIAADTRGNLYAGWIDGRVSGEWGGACGFARSTDGGLTWSPTEVFLPEGQKAGNDPVVAADESGNLYRLCMGVFGPGPFPHYHSRSTDGGATWSPWVKGLNGDKPWMTARGGKLYKVWTYGGSLNFSISPDGGDTWTSPTRIGQGLGSCIAVDDTGSLHVATGLMSIVYLKSTDGGATWAKAKEVGRGNGVIGGGGGAPVRASVASCAVSPDGRDVYASWAGANNKSAGSSEWDVWSAHSGDGGDTWDAPARVNDEGRSGVIAFNQWTALDRAGTVHAAWVDDRNKVQEAWYSNSSDKGRTWSTNLRISNAAPANGWNTWAGHYAQSAVLPDGNVVYAYSDQRDGTPDVWLSRVRGAEPQRLARIEVEPKTAIISADQMLGYVARGYDQGGAPMAISPAWTASGGLIDQTGRFEPVQVGTLTVTASQSGVSGTATVTVNAGALATLTVVPGEATITVDEIQVFTALGADSKGNPVGVSPSWSSSGGAVDPNGLFTPESVGEFAVTASEGGLTAGAKVTVVPGLPFRIVVDPPAVVTSALRTVKLYATAEDRAGTRLDGIDSFEWSVSGPVGRLDKARGAWVELYTDTILWVNGEITVALHGLTATVPVTVKGSPYPIDKGTTPGDIRSGKDSGFLALYPSFLLFWAALLIALVVAGLAARAWRRRKRSGGAGAPANRDPEGVPLQ